MLRCRTLLAAPREFQSAPAIAGGRCRSPGEVDPVRLVSIRARHCWRAMRLHRKQDGYCAWVSIRARHCWRAKHPRRPALRRPARSFNPRPPLLAGDARWSRNRQLHPSCFNPRPPLLAGDALARAAGLGGALVSIRARHCWRAMRVRARKRLPRAWFQSAPAIAGGRCRRWGLSKSGVKGFNPRPPLLAGDASTRAAVRHRRSVSIRARHCWRAMPGTVQFHRHQRRRFNPRPPLLAGDAPARSGVSTGGASFNPRPPLLAGDAAYAHDMGGHRTVSIRARHCWRAMPSSIVFLIT